MSSDDEGNEYPKRMPDWYPQLSRFRTSDGWRATWQLINTLVPYGCLWYLMAQSVQLQYPYVVTLSLSLPAAAFLVRIFILFHDCVHASSFVSKRANIFFGYILGLLVFTSFEDWRITHVQHHATYANLDARGIGDVWTMTLEEFHASSKTMQLLYRLYRNPLVLIGFGALFNFILHNRLPTGVKRKQWVGVLFTNLLLISVILIAARTIGWQTYLLVQLPVLWLAGAGGIWLFYVQHQFEGGYWARESDWKPFRAAMEGSSFYRLPAVLRWFTGNIGFHHIHHLSPGIPNYHLNRCYNAIDELRTIKPLTIMRSLSCMRLKLWDESQQKMVTFPCVSGTAK